MALELDLEKAEKDLEEGEEGIEKQTALNWAARAVVIFERYSEDKNPENLSWGDDMLHEALEHAALSEDVSLVEEIKTFLDEKREEAVSRAAKKAKANLSTTLCAAEMKVTAADVLPFDQSKRKIQPGPGLKTAPVGPVSDPDIDMEMIDAVRAQYDGLQQDIQEIAQAVASVISEASNPTLILEFQKMLVSLKVARRAFV